MEQAYTHFNSGKYKEAVNLLSTSNQNYESYQPNVAICQYLSNRCTQAALNCLRKLNDILPKKIRPEEEDNVELRSQHVIKYNIAVLLLLLGKRDNALVVMRQVYTHKECFIEYAQCRILFLLMELEIYAKNPIEALRLYQKFPNKPQNIRNPQNQWISVALHQHNKTSAIAGEQFYFIAQTFVVQALLQLGFRESSLNLHQQREKKKEILLDKVRKRKNNANKYYEINIQMIDRFLLAQRELFNSAYEKALFHLNLNNIHEEFENVPMNKLITNIYGSLATSNIGVIHAGLGKPSLALHYFRKARDTLYKIAPPDDKELLIITTNYTNQLQKLYQNIALTLLGRRIQQAYVAYQNLLKNNRNSCNYQSWYRIGQSALQMYLLLEQEKSSSKNKTILKSAKDCFCNALICMDLIKVPELNLTRFYNYLKEEDIQIVIMRNRGEQMSFKISIMLLIGYVSLLLQDYFRVISICQQIQKLKSPNIQSTFYAQIYLIEAYLATNRTQDAKAVLVDAQKTLTEDHKQAPSFHKRQSEVHYWSTNKIESEDHDENTMFLYHMCLVHVMSDRLQQALQVQQVLLQHPRVIANAPKSIKLLTYYLNLKIGGDPKAIAPYMKGLSF